MKAIAFFNNKGGVGKTSLVYHLGWMFNEIGFSVLMADLDPQANLTSVAIPERELEALFERTPRRTIFAAVDPLKRGVGDVRNVETWSLSERLSLLPGDLDLSNFEDELSAQWPKCVDRDERAFRVVTAFYRVVAISAEQVGADVVLIDVGPNFGAINRAALIASDYVVIPVAPDLFSVQGLQNVGERLVDWRRGWADRVNRAPAFEFALPGGEMRPIGYVISRHSVFAGGPVKAFQRWIEKIPVVYRNAVEHRGSNDPIVGHLSAEQDPFRLARLKDYRSLMPMAQERNKPVFHLKPADGAIGGHQSAVLECYHDFEGLTRRIAQAIGLVAPVD